MTTLLRQPLLVEIAAGELLDKITILEIKRSRIRDRAKLANVQGELEVLTAARARALAEPAELSSLIAELKTVNERLWDVEDALRQCERDGDFGSRFIALARSVYQLNDRRAQLKRRINEACGSPLIEEKEYTAGHDADLPLDRLPDAVVAVSANGRAAGALSPPYAREQQRRANGASSDVEALVGQGLRLAEQGRAEEAVAVLRQAVQARPDSARARHNLGVALAQLSRHDEAVGALEEALRLRPDYADACFNLGNALRELGRTDEAIARCRQALQLRPDHASAANNLGLTLIEAGRAAEAVESLQRAVALQPGKKEGHNNLGLAYADLGRFADAEACYQAALRLDAGYVEAHTNLGSACKEQGRLEEAVACYQQALWLEPDSAVTHYNRALTWLQQGDYARGWPEYEWRWRRRQAQPRHGDRPRWGGSPLAGRTILLWREQGLGDTIQFVRYATLVRRQGGRVVVECPACLVRLLSSCRGIDILVAEKERLPEFDVQAPLLSLPALLKTTLASVPAEVPYLHAEPEREASWRQRLGVRQAFRVGVVWQGNPYFRGDRHRSFPLGSLAPLAAVAGVQLISLQKEHGLEQLTAAERGFPITVLEGLDASGGAFVDTAAVMRSLDLVVTADTAAAHVAGALGVPVWLALSRAPDWRWGLSGERTPWYPSLRLFRQSQLGDWPSLFERMAAALQQEARKKTS